MNESRPYLRKWLRIAVKLLIVALVVWAVHGTIIHAVAELHKHPWTFHPGWLAVSGALYLLGLLPEGLFWHRALRALGQDVALGRTLRAYYIGHLGKYVPGKAMVVVLRTGLICGRGVDTGIAAASVFLETLTMMAVGMFVAVAILAFRYARHGVLFWTAAAGAKATAAQIMLAWLAAHPLVLWVILLGLMAAAALPTLPPVFSRLARLAGVGRSNPAVAAKLAQFRYGTLLWGWVAMTVGWVLMGAGLWAALKALGVQNADLTGQLHLDTAAVALATVLGFFSFVPGGAVVREAVLAELLAPQVGDLVAVASVVVLRLVGVVAESLISGILYMGGGRAAEESDDGPHC